MTPYGAGVKRLSMYRLAELVRLHRMGTSGREVARLLKMGPNTERRYRNILALAQLLDGPVDAVPDASVLRAAIDKAQPETTTPQQTSSVEQWREPVSAMLDGGAEATSIYDRLRLEQPGFSGSLSAIKRLCIGIKRARGIGADDVVIPVETPAGDVAQVDFGGAGLRWDPETKRQRQAYFFVLVLGFSRHMFVRLVFDQKLDTWLRLHVEAFTEWGAVPRTIVPDNLKAAVVRAAFGVHDEPELNRSYRELARHFGFKIDPTPAYSPEKKGKVESGVKYVKRNFLLSRNAETDADVLRTELGPWVREIAGMRRHGTTHKRPLEQFEQIERAAMLPLPAKSWEPVLWRTPTLRRDSHALVEGARYSAPWRMIGKTLWARVTAHSVELYFEDTRVATHERKAEGGMSTLDEHLPAVRRDYRHRQREYWEERAEKLGDDVLAYIRELFDSDDVLNQVTKAQTIVGHLERFPVERARAACRRASYFGSYSFKSIKSILLKGLDTQPLPTVIVPASGVIEAPRFARTVQELLDLPLEDTNAPN